MTALAQSKCASLLSNMQVLAGLALVFVIARIAAQQTNLPNSKIIFLSHLYWNVPQFCGHFWQSHLWVCYVTKSERIAVYWNLLEQVLKKQKSRNALNGRFTCCCRSIPSWLTRSSSSTDPPALRRTPIRSHRTCSAWTTSWKIQWTWANGLSTKLTFPELLLWRPIFAGKYENIWN